MKFSFSILVTLFASPIHVIAFTPSAAVERYDNLGDSVDRLTATRSSRIGVKVPSFMSVMSDEEVGAMSELDEAVLFGEQPVQVSPKRTRDTYGNLLPAFNTPTNPLDHSPSNPLINKLNAMRYTIDNCPQIWTELATICPNKRALFDSHMCDEKIDLTFAEASSIIRKTAGIFQNLGVVKGTNVAILGENSAKWLLLDHGLQLAGGVSAVRGADAPADELRYIYEHSDSAGVVVLQGPKLLKKLAMDAKKKNLQDEGNPSPLGLYNESHGAVKTVILMHAEKKTAEDIETMVTDLGLGGVNVLLFQDLLDAAGDGTEKKFPALEKDDVATIVYTSGTTGQPKGVMLAHGNLIHQTGHRLAPSKQWDESEPVPGECMLSLLPVWHITERAFELWMLTRGCSVVYSNIRSFKGDLAKHQPEWLVLVPRVLEKVAMGVQDKFSKGSIVVKTLVKIFTITSGLRSKHSKIINGLVVGDSSKKGGNKIVSSLILAALAPLNALGDKLVWSKVQDGFGGKNKVIISGGSALAGSLETFYEDCGMTISVGYGLTECAPLIAHRRSDNNLVTGGCVGQACVDTELRVVDPEIKPGDIKGERPALPDGEIGVVIARGPQIMKGYYKNPEATAKAVDRFGFFDTGDLGRINPATGDLILTGRCKDTIVLSNGENIEPQPIEDAILGQSPSFEQVMLTGQDGRSLTAIVVLNPNELVNAGLMDSSKGAALQNASEKVNDPKCTEEECAEEIALLNDASTSLRNDESLQKALMADVRAATKGFRAWEQVGNLYVTLEPFAMSNGLLTQSYKVKRDAVSNRYAPEL